MSTPTPARSEMPSEAIAAIAERLQDEIDIDDDQALWLAEALATKFFDNLPRGALVLALSPYIDGIGDAERAVEAAIAAARCSVLGHESPSSCISGYEAMSSLTSAQALRALAEKATPAALGPWHYVPWHVAEGPAQVRTATYLLCELSSDDIAAFVAAANPAAVLALLDELAAARALLSAWRYAKAFAGAEAWDGGHDMKQRFALVDSVTAQAGIEAAETLDEFRAHLADGGQARKGK